MTTDTRAALIAAYQKIHGCERRKWAASGPKDASRAYCDREDHGWWTPEGCPVAVAAADHPALAAVLAQVWDEGSCSIVLLGQKFGEDGTTSLTFSQPANPYRA